MATKAFVSTVASRLKGKVALITGGASGIGQCTAELFAKHGAKVVIADIQDHLGHTVRDAIGPSNCTYIHCDVTDEDNISNAVNQTVETYGKLDILFNNAGLIDHNLPRIIHDDKGDFERVLRTNVTGVFLGMKHAARVMVPAKSGNIISTTSISSVIGGTASHAYTCSKHAVVGLTKNLAVELGKFGIRVNCVSPYGISTPLARTSTGLKEEQLEAALSMSANLKGVTLKVEDVANAALYLASDEGKYISGLNLIVDGGFSIQNSAVQGFQ